MGLGSCGFGGQESMRHGECWVSGLGVGLQGNGAELTSDGSRPRSPIRVETMGHDSVSLWECVDSGGQGRGEEGWGPQGGGAGGCSRCCQR